MERLGRWQASKRPFLPSMTTRIFSLSTQYNAFPSSMPSFYSPVAFLCCILAVRASCNVKDELGTLNSYSYENDPSKKEDSRWVHRCLAPQSSELRPEQEKLAARLKGKLFLFITRSLSASAIFSSCFWMQLRAH